MWDEWVAKIDEADGEYILVREDTSRNYAHRINSGGLAAFRPPGAYHAVTRNNKGYTGQRVDIWVRRVK